MIRRSLCLLTALLLAPLAALHAAETAPAGKAPSTTHAARREQYLLLNYSTSLASPKQTAEMMTYVRDTFGAANRASSLKVGVAIIYTPKEQLAKNVARVKADLELARRLQVPVLIQVDTENWLPESLLNWHDPQRPGFDPAKVDDVEWFGWTPDTAVKLCWRNWGTMVRVGPHPNLLSPRFQAWEKARRGTAGSRTSSPPIPAASSPRSTTTIR